MTEKGVIIKGIGGFYYVKTGSGLYECRARGIFRKKKQQPLVGDKVIISIHENGLAMVDEILPRQNFLVRPPLANMDILFVVISSCSPQPNTIVIDRLIAHAENKGIEPVPVFTKADLSDCFDLQAIYQKAGFQTVLVDYRTNSGIEEIKMLMQDKISAFAGNSGVGKSTLLNAIMPALKLETGEISEKLGRGRHTTRQAELFATGFGGMIADTPGFSSLDIERGEVIYKERLPECFREFSEYLGKCKFNSCAHTVEKGCAVLEALKENKISQSRHDSYIALYNEVKDLQEWEYKENHV